MKLTKRGKVLAAAVIIAAGTAVGVGACGSSQQSCTLEGATQGVNFYLQTDQPVDTGKCDDALKHLQNGGTGASWNRVATVPSGYVKVCDGGTVSAYFNQEDEMAMQADGIDPSSVCQEG